jgi:hypothetical protein
VNTLSVVAKHFPLDLAAIDPELRRLVDSD